MAPKAVVAIPLRKELLDELSEFDLTLVPAGRTDEAAFLSAISEAEGVLVSSSVFMDRVAIESAPNLRVISTMSVGFDHIDMKTASGRGITVTITPVLSDAVADLTLMLMTMLARRIPDAIRAVASGGWGGLALGTDLAGKKLLIVGFGRIGQAVAARAKAALMDIEFLDARSDVPDAAGARRAPEWASAFATADFVSIHVDLNPGTRGLVGRSELKTMKPTAFLVNTSRGPVVDQAALVESLNEGEIAGAALDVLEQEPPSHGDPILKAPNVIILPHIGSATNETRAAMARCAVDNLAVVLRHGASPHALSPHAPSPHSRPEHSRPEP
jgi:lactate dehydrogenase-like 2-hydroxyacid dehydrogenase